jgi:DNA-directed RNA polymerase III subunit RPC2
MGRRKGTPDPVRSLNKSSIAKVSSNIQDLQEFVSNLDTRSKTPFKWGQVRATPYGNCLDSLQNGRDASEWHANRNGHLKPYNPPVEGYGHVFGQPTIDAVDNIELGNAELSEPESNQNSGLKHAHDFGSTKTADDCPVGSLKDKWRLLPHFLQLRSLMRQHIDSFDHFVNVELKQIVQSESAREIRSEHDPNFYLRYTDCWVGEPKFVEDSYVDTALTPFQCRLRDCTYSAPIYVNVRYTRGRQIVDKKNVIIGRMPIMLRSEKCMLRNKTEAQLAAMKECPYDPGGYFIVKGVEKVILIQEQLSKNRVILEEDPKGEIQASITSSTRERKSKAYIAMKNGKVYMRNNTLGDEMPIAVILKAMGIESDMEAVQLVGSEDFIVNALALSLEEPRKLGIYTQLQALKYIGSKIRRYSTSYRKPLAPEDEAREILGRVVLSHVPVNHFDFRAKAIYVGHITRRVLMVHLGKNTLDDKDYYGNKRLELAGNLLSLLFEDLFKIFNANLKRQADMVLSKPNRAQAYDVARIIQPDTITNGMINAIATGNWVLKRFRMDRAGVTQVLTRLSYMSAAGMMTRINSQFEKTRKVSGPRSLQPSQWGMLCPADTPEGEACGLVKNLALLAHITTDEDTQPIERLCRDLGVEDVSRLTGHEIHSHQAYLVLLNGLILGVHTQPNVLVKNLRSLRRRGLAGEFASFYLHEGQRAVHIATDGGRVCRPLIIVDEGTGLPRLKQLHVEALALKTMDVRDLLRQGIVEYVDCNEENNTLIAVTERDLELVRKQGIENLRMRYTHLEIDPFTVLGVVGGIIPVSFLSLPIYPHRHLELFFLLMIVAYLMIIVSTSQSSSTKYLHRCNEQTGDGNYWYKPVRTDGWSNLYACLSSKTIC